MWQWFVDAFDGLIDFISAALRAVLTLFYDLFVWLWEGIQWVVKSIVAWAWDEIVALLQPFAAQYGVDPNSLKASLMYFVNAAQTLDDIFPIITIINIYLTALAAVIVLRGLKVARHWLPI